MTTYKSLTYFIFKNKIKTPPKKPINPLVQDDLNNLYTATNSNPFSEHDLHRKQNTYELLTILYKRQRYKNT